MLSIVFSSVILALIVTISHKYLTGDGDFTLLLKGKVKRESFQDKVVWITGASRGIGEVLAKQLATLGANIIISARNEPELERVKKEISDLNLGKHGAEGVEILPLDLSSGEDEIRKIVEKAVSLFGGVGVDYVIHNAAYERPKSTALDVPEASLKATLDVNVMGPISLTRLLLPHMLKRGKGHFGVMSSAAGKAPAPGQAVYPASKFALNGYFHSLRSEFYQKGIMVTVVCPGPIETSDTTTSKGQKTVKEKRVPSERCAELTLVAASHDLKEAWISYQPLATQLFVTHPSLDGGTSNSILLVRPLLDFSKEDLYKVVAQRKNSKSKLKKM